MVVQESFGALPVSASGVVIGASGGNMGGFLCSVSGTLKLTYTIGGVTIVDTTPVTAGVFLPLPFVFSSGVTVTLASGATGTFAIN